MCRTQAKKEEEGERKRGQSLEMGAAAAAAAAKKAAAASAGSPLTLTKRNNAFRWVRVLDWVVLALGGANPPGWLRDESHYRCFTACVVHVSSGAIGPRQLRLRGPITTPLFGLGCAC